jgi:hypothetical protein
VEAIVVRRLPLVKATVESQSVARLEVALRSPIAFHSRGPNDFAPPIDVLKAPPETVGIQFEGREFVWHPPMAREWEDLGVLADGPMVSVVVTDDDDKREAARSLQRFLSAVAFEFDQPAEDVSYGGGGGSGETDPYHWSGPRAPQAFAWIAKHAAPLAIEVDADRRLRVALAYYREGLNAGSPFYKVLAFWNVLASAFEVEYETPRQSSTPTAEAQRRDDFIRHRAPQFAWRGRRAPHMSGDLAVYLRDEARNAIAHVLRKGRREIDPDDPSERVRLSDDAWLLHRVARAAILEFWATAVRVRSRS